MCICHAEFDHPPTQEELQSPGTYSFLAFSAIEDKLADYVPETLQMFSSAGISIFLLTGDAAKTAINISHKCGIINSESALCVFEPVDKNFVENFDIRHYPPLKRYEYGVMTSKIILLIINFFCKLCLI